MTTAHSGSGDLQRALDLLWGMKEAPKRGPKPGLTLERVVATAVDVADDEGLDAVSMRRVATELGVGTMSLYRYVPGKTELLELMLDHVQAFPPDVDADEFRRRGWRTVMETTGRGVWEMYLAHPWLLQVSQARPLLGPNGVAGLDVALSGLEGLRLTDRERMGVVVALDGFVSGSARTYLQGLEAAKRTGISDEEFWQAQGPYLDKAMRSGNFPSLARLSPETFDATGVELFEFGLQRILDGFAVLIDAAAERADTDVETDTGGGDGAGDCR
ncbi:TetR/AcrR family transcriptional regulator [Streptomyces armeniacus]|uniref:TetR/AcrR family transcriptional regulator n=1 Tax=Streptomyces armeniacus TaxID=83291 RepID=A0A345XZQ7_9ACTN|nr:TetR/AcrR family transcriptional regulator [Streptomyces armeniacus]AXK37123.1 TetR/AcrR family transcriptional regulator [Streptomyces armeniacus]